jgi:hypothetical protein
MVKAVVLYGPLEDPDAFERDDPDTHTGPATAIAGLQRFEADQAAVNDIPNFATGGVTIFFAEVD